MPNVSNSLQEVMLGNTSLWYSFQCVCGYMCNQENRRRGRGRGREGEGGRGREREGEGGMGIEGRARVWQAGVSCAG